MTTQKPGDTVNGHILGRDNVWHRLAGEEGPQTTAPPRTDPAPVQRTGPVPHGAPAPGLRYGVRYRGRWIRTVLIVGAVLGFAETLSQTQGEGDLALILLTFFVAAVGDGLVVGTLVNFVVALYPGALEKGASTR